MSKTAAFSIFGAFCNHWFDAPHGFTVCFQRVPNEEEMTRLGHLFEVVLKEGPVCSDRPWEWSVTFAHFKVEERYDCASFDAPPIGKVKWFLRQAHEIVPLVDAVYENATEVGDPTEFQQAVPGPDWGVNSLRALNPDLPSPALNQAFENGRRAGLEEATRSKNLRTLEKEKGKKAHLEPRPKIPEPPEERWSEQDLAPFDLPDTQLYGSFSWLPRVRMINMGSWLKPAPGDQPLVHEPLRRVAVVMKDGEGIREVVWIDDDNVRQTVDFPEDFRLVRGFAMHPSGNEAVISTDTFLFKLDFTTCQAHVLYRLPDGHGMFTDVAYLHGGTRLAFGTLPAIHVLDPAAKTPEALASIKGHGGMRMSSFLEGRAFVVENVSGPKVYACSSDRLKKIAVSKANVAFGFEHERQLYFASQGDWFEWVGLADAVDAFVAKK